MCCIQETHLNSNHRFSIRRYETFRRDKESGQKGGLLILVPKNYNHPAVKIYRSEDADTEVLGIKLLLEGNILSIYNLYSPPPKTPSLHNIKPDGERWIIVGDFNSHFPSWGYPDIDSKREEVEDLIITNQMVFINDPTDPHTSCPDLAIATYDVTKITRHHVEQQLGGSDLQTCIPPHQERLSTHKHKAVSKLELQKKKLDRIPKADQYFKDLDLDQQHLNNKVTLFTTILTAATETIPRGRRRNYIPLWNGQLEELHNAVSKLREKMELCPTDENTQAQNKANAEYTRKIFQQTRVA